MKNILAGLVGLSIAFGFIYVIYRFLPLGVALSITGGCLGTLALDREDVKTYWVGTIGSWLVPIGVIFAFFTTGWLSGIAAIILGFVAYSTAKQRNVS